VSDVPYDELDPNVRELVRVLNETLGLETTGSCGGHENPNPAQQSAGQWLVTIDRPYTEDGWMDFEFLAWFVNDARRAGAGINLIAAAYPPWLNEPGTTLYFALFGWEDTPDEWAARILKTLDGAFEKRDTANVEIKPLHPGKPTHAQVELPELGFTVDEGLEELIGTCWRRGIGTFISCIGTDWHNGDAYIGFTDPNCAARWEKLTGRAAEWDDDDEVATVAEAYFPASELPALVAALRYEEDR